MHPLRDPRAGVTPRPDDCTGRECPAPARFAYPRAVEATRRAVARWREAVAYVSGFCDGQLDEALPPHGDPARSQVVGLSNTWQGLAHDEQSQAESHLITCIVAMCDREKAGLWGDYRDAERRGQPGRALALDGVLYLLIPEVEYEALPEGEPTKDRYRAVHLVTMPLDALTFA